MPENDELPSPADTASDQSHPLNPFFQTMHLYHNSEDKTFSSSLGGNHKLEINISNFKDLASFHRSLTVLAASDREIISTLDYLRKSSVLTTIIATSDHRERHAFDAMIATDGIESADEIESNYESNDEVIITHNLKRSYRQGKNSNALPPELGLDRHLKMARNAITLGAYEVQALDPKSFVSASEPTSQLARLGRSSLPSIYLDDFCRELDNVPPRFALATINEDGFAVRLPSNARPAKPSDFFFSSDTSRQATRIQCRTIDAS